MNDTFSGRLVREYKPLNISGGFSPFSTDFSSKSEVSPGDFSLSPDTPEHGELSCW
jgi:hypothetical protein